MLYKEGMRGQKTNFYVESQKSGRPRPNGGGGKRGEPVVTGGEVICLDFAVDPADTIWNFLSFSTGLDVSGFIFETTEKCCTSWQVWCRQKQRLFWGMTHNLTSTVRVIWEVRGIMSQFCEALVWTCGTEQHGGCQANMWTWLCTKDLGKIHTWALDVGNLIASLRTQLVLWASSEAGLAVTGSMVTPHGMSVLQQILPKLTGQWKKTFSLSYHPCLP